GRSSTFGTGKRGRARMEPCREPNGNASPNVPCGAGRSRRPGHLQEPRAAEPGCVFTSAARKPVPLGCGRGGRDEYARSYRNRSAAPAQEPGQARGRCLLPPPESAPKQGLAVRHILAALSGGVLQGERPAGARRNPPARARPGIVGEEDENGKVAVCPAGAIRTPPAAAC